MLVLGALLGLGCAHPPSERPPAEGPPRAQDGPEESATPVPAATPERANEANEANEANDPAVSRALLDDYVELLRTIVVMGGGAEPALEHLRELERRAESSTTIGHELRARYLRLLDVTRMAVEPAQDARREEIEQALAAFVGDVQGEGVAFDAGGGLAAIATAMVDEVINLHLLSDSSRDPKEVRAEVERQLGAGG